MAVAHRVFRRYLEQRTARQVVARLFRAMSRDQAKRVLKLSPGATPSETEINQAYQKLVKEVIRSNPGAAVNQEELKELNIAKDTLRGQFDRRDPDYKGPNAPEGPGPDRPRQQQRPQQQQQQQHRRPPPPPPPPREEEPPLPPPPPPEGEPFAAAFHGLGSIDWKIATQGNYKSEVVMDADWTPGSRKVYWKKTQDFIVVGKTATHYVFAKLTRRTHSRDDYRDKTIHVRWEGMKVTQPAEKDLLKLGPKIIKGLREGAHGVAKFAVVEGTLTEENIEKKVRASRLSFPDAVIGSGILGEGAEAPQGRKIQVELEPILNPAKAKAVRSLGQQDWHNAYDWFVVVNGRKTELNAGELSDLMSTYIPMGVFSYDYSKGKKNLTRLKGGRFGLTPRMALEQLAFSLDAGPTKDAVLKAIEAFPE